MIISLHLRYEISNLWFNFVFSSSEVFALTKPYQFRYQSVRCYKQSFYLSFFKKMTVNYDVLFPASVIMISALAITVPSFDFETVHTFCKAQIGSISVTVTIEPAPRKEAAVPFPTSPYPQTTNFFLLTSCQWLRMHRLKIHGIRICYQI